MAYLVEAWERDGKGVARYAHIHTGKAAAVTAFKTEQIRKPRCVLITLTRPGKGKYAGEYNVWAHPTVDLDLVPDRDWIPRTKATAQLCPHCGGIL
mgnify:CR=1 FL=1